MLRHARPAGGAPPLNEAAFWDDAFALAQEMRCGSDEVVAERWDRMVQQYSGAWMQWLSNQVGGLTEHGVVRRLFASGERPADAWIAQIPEGALRALAAHLARAVPELDGLEFDPALVAAHLREAMELELALAAQGRRPSRPLLDRFTERVADDARHLGTAAPAIHALWRTAGDTSDCAGLVIFRPETGEVLLVRRSKDDTRPGQWEFPGGHIRDGETAARGGAREAREELGRLPKRLRYRMSLESPIPDGTYTNVFVEMDDDAYEPELNREHDAWGWFSVENLPDPVNPGVLKALEHGPWGLIDHDCCATQEIDDLADYLMADRGDDFGNSESAVEMAIRLLMDGGH